MTSASYALPSALATSGDRLSHSKSFLVDLWRNLLERLSLWDANWYDRVSAEPAALRALPPSGPIITNREAFEAFALALLSGNTRWDRIERVQSELERPFQDFDPVRFAHADDATVAGVVKWFRERQAGAPRLRGTLSLLRQTARILAGESEYASANALIVSAFVEAGYSPEHSALLLGTSARWKLPGFGVALAAEGLRNLGFDLCKPDRHVIRALASWELVSFPRWDHRGPFTAPTARPKDLLKAMLAIRQLAEANGLPVTRASSAVWIAGAVSGVRLSNAELAELTPR